MPKHNGSKSFLTCLLMYIKHFLNCVQSWTSNPCTLISWFDLVLRKKYRPLYHFDCHDMITTLICSHFENIWLDHFRGQVRIKKKLICHTHHQITLGLIKYERENEGKKWRGKIGCRRRRVWFLKQIQIELWRMSDL